MCFTSLAIALLTWSTQDQQHPTMSDMAADKHELAYLLTCTSNRVCLDHHLIAIRSPGIRGNHLRSGTSLIVITWLRRLSLSRLLYKLGLTGHLETVINCTVMHATWRGGWELSQHQQPVARCGGDPGVSECTVQQWVVAEKTNSPDWLQWLPCATLATHDVGGKMVARGVALDVQLLLNRWH